MLKPLSNQDFEVCHLGLRGTVCFLIRECPLETVRSGMQLKIINSGKRAVDGASEDVVKAEFTNNNSEDCANA